MLKLILIVLALVLFLVAAFGFTGRFERVSFVAGGLAAWVATELPIP